METSCRKKYKPSSKKWILASKRTGFRRNSALIPANAGLFHYAGNNPIRYIDPDGRDDLYYNESGKWIETEKSKTNKVYVKIDGVPAYLCEKEKFIDYVAAVFGETGWHQEEANAISDVIENRSVYTDRTISDIVKTTGIYGYNSDTINATNSDLEKNNNGKMLMARTAVIHSLTSNKDVSEGSYFWEGLKYINPQSPNYRSNNWFVKKGWGNTPGKNGIISYSEVKRIGGTVFMINNPDIRRKCFP